MTLVNVIHRKFVLYKNKKREIFSFLIMLNKQTKRFSAPSLGGSQGQGGDFLTRAALHCGVRLFLALGPHAYFSAFPKVLWAAHPPLNRCLFC